MAPSKKFMECLQFAAYKHRDQRRKNVNQTPYINHPINVATILSAEGHIDDESVLMSALLHDTVEDTETTFDEIEVPNQLFVIEFAIILSCLFFSNSLELKCAILFARSQMTRHWRSTYVNNYK